MNDFEYDAYQKKQIARSASHRVGKRTGCALPSDILTPAQMKKKNGPVVTYKTNKPLAWKDFKALPVDIAVGYYNKLTIRFQVGPSPIAKMFGVSPGVIYQFEQKHNVKLERPRSGITSEPAKKAFEFWWNNGGDGKTISEPQESPVEEKTEETPQPPESPVEEKVSGPVTLDSAPSPISLRRFQLEINDAQSWGDIFEYVSYELNMPLPAHATVRIVVEGGSNND